MNFQKLTLVVGVAISLVGCKGGGGSSDSSDSRESTVVSEEQVREYLEFSNRSSYMQCVGGCMQTGTVRFSKETLIPLYYISQDGSEPDPQIVQAIDNLEGRLGDVFTDIYNVTGDVEQFRDTSSVGNTSNGKWDQLTHDADKEDTNGAEFLHQLSITNGLIISVGTAYNPDPSQYKDMCANFSNQPYSGGVAIEFTADHKYKSDFVGWINLGGPQTVGCWDTEIVMHETAHSMGLTEHFAPYFGKWSKTAMDVLATLYSNEPNTPFESVSVDQ